MYPELGPENELIVVGDGHYPHVPEMLTPFPLVRYFELPERTFTFGCAPCDRGMDEATGDYAFFIGDDDTPIHGVFNIIRTQIEAEPNRVHVFAMQWKDITLKRCSSLGTISGQQLVVPLKGAPRMMETIDKRPVEESDFAWIEATIDHFGTPVYHDEVIAILPDFGRGRIF